MKKIQNTELEHSDEEGDILDYFLGGISETKEQWAQRVWDCCERQANGEDIASVYIASEGQTWQERALELWENKKSKRREVLKKDLNLKDEDLKSLKQNPKFKTRIERDILSRG